MENKVCKFHQSGHCKFGSTCKHQHIQHTCTNTTCERSTCTARHPRPCVYHTRFGHCKFGSNCSYLHINTTDDTVIETLKKGLEHMFILLKAKDNEMKALEEKVNKMEDLIKHFPCDVSAFKETTNTGLKTHTHISHKAPEEKPFKCGECEYTAKTKTVLKRHYTMKHKVDDSWKYPSSTQKVKCFEEDCDISDKEFFFDHDFAMHYYTEHQFMFTCDHCHRPLPGPDTMLELHHNLCTSPCSGDPHCYCKNF